MCQEPAHRPLEEWACGLGLDAGAADAAEKGDGPGRAMGEAQVSAPCRVLLPGFRVQNSRGWRPPVDSMLIALGVFVQPLDDPVEAFDRRGAWVPLQCVHAEAGDSHDK